MSLHPVILKFLPTTFWAVALTVTVEGMRFAKQLGKPHFAKVGPKESVGRFKVGTKRLPKKKWKTQQNNNTKSLENTIFCWEVNTHLTDVSSWLFEAKAFKTSEIPSGFLVGSGVFPLKIGPCHNPDPK